MAQPDSFRAFTISVANTDTIVERELLMPSPLVRWLVKLGNERTNMHSMFGLDVGGPVRVDP